MAVVFPQERPIIQSALLGTVRYLIHHTLFVARANFKLSFSSGCVYVSTDQWKGHDDWLKAAVKKILGCQDAAVNKVNGAMADKVGDAFSVCVSDGKGCGDCLQVYPLRSARVYILMLYNLLQRCFPRPEWRWAFWHHSSER
jgi:hypothetical protein